MNKQVFSHLITTDMLEGVKRASEVGNLQFHRFLTPNADPFAGQNEFHDRVTAAFNEVAELEQEVCERVSAIFAKYELGDHGFGASISVYYDRAEDSYQHNRKGEV
jgi:replication fork clamp-binding protein CrfC